MLQLRLVKDSWAILQKEVCRSRLVPTCDTAHPHRIPKNYDIFNIEMLHTMMKGGVRGWGLYTDRVLPVCFITRQAVGDNSSSHTRYLKSVRVDRETLQTLNSCPDNWWTHVDCAWTPQKSWLYAFTFRREWQRICIMHVACDSPVVLTAKSAVLRWVCSRSSLT